MIKEARSSPRGAEGGPTGEPAREGFPSQRELIVITKPEAALLAKPETEAQFRTRNLLGRGNSNREDNYYVFTDTQ